MIAQVKNSKNIILLDMLNTGCTKDTPVQVQNNSSSELQLDFFKMKFLQECKDIQIAMANKRYTQVIKQQQKNHINSGIIALRYTQNNSAVKE